MGNMTQAALLKLKRNCKNQIRQQHGHLKWAELIVAEPKMPERFIASPCARFRTNQGCGGDEVRNVLVHHPQQPEAPAARTPAFRAGLYYCIRFSYTGPATPLLVSPIH